MTKDTYLFWFKSAPFESLSFREGLDSALAYAAFDQEVALYFDKEAVPALLPTKSQLIKQKDISKNLKALGMYDIEILMADGDTLETFEKKGIKPIINANKVATSELCIDSYKQILIF